MAHAWVFLICTLLRVSAQTQTPSADEDLGIEGSLVLDITPEDLRGMIEEATQQTEQAGGKKSLLVNFYAPWCSHCKKLAPEYSEIATDLQASVIFARMDCVAHKEFCVQQFQITYYPTLYFFHAHSGDKGEEYPGKTEGVMIKNWVTMHFAEPWEILDSAEKINDFISQGKKDKQLTLIGHISSDALLQQFKVWVSQLYLKNKPNKYRYGLVTSSAIEKNEVRLHTWFDAETFSTEFSKNVDLNTWLKNRELPLCGEITPKSFDLYKEQKLPLVLVFMSKNSGVYNEWTKQVTVIAEEYRGKFLFARLDMDMYKDVSFRLGVTTNLLPGIVITNVETRKHYPLHLEYSPQNLREHCAAYLQQKLAPLSRTQLRPSPDRWMQESLSKDPKGTGIQDVYTNTWEATVKDPSKHVLVFFDAPWCKECSLLRLKYPLVAEHFRNRSDVVIATIDVSSNEGDFIVPDVLPGLTFFTTDNKAGIPYVGGRDLEELKFFVFQRIEDVEKKISKDKSAAAAPTVQDIEFPEHDEI